MSTIQKEYLDSVIKHECSHADWVDLEDHVKMMGEDELEEFAARFRLKPHSTWQHYMGEIQHLTWREFIRSYEAITRREY